MKKIIYRADMKQRILIVNLGIAQASPALNILVRLPKGTSGQKTCRIHVPRMRSVLIAPMLKLLKPNSGRSILGNASKQDLTESSLHTADTMLHKQFCMNLQHC